MSKDKSRIKNANKARSQSKTVKIPAVSVVNNIVFSNKEVWAYYKLSSIPYDFLTNEGRAKLSSDILVAFTALSQRVGSDIDFQILVTNTPFNVDAWEKQMFDMYDTWSPRGDRLQTFNSFVHTQAESLKESEYKKRVTYLGVRLFSRGGFDKGNFQDFKLSDTWDFVKRGLSTVLQMPDENLSKIELSRAKADEREVFRTIRTGSLRGSRVTSEEILLVMKKVLYPAMPSPYLEVNHDERVGLNDIVMETGATIEDHRKHLKIKQVIDGKEREGYRATLSFAKFPANDMVEPNGIDPFMYLPTMLSLPYTMTARFTLVPVDKMKKDLQKKKLENEDELNNLGSSGQRASSTIMETQHDIDKLDYELSNDNMPWVTGNYRLTIEKDNVEALETAISQISQEYAKTDTILIRTVGDQLEMMMEEFPGGTLQSNDFSQITNLAMLGVAGFSYGGHVGDPVVDDVVLRRDFNE